jgi:retron-type reverse transcriptase
VAARQSRHTRFTALLHHVDEAALLRAFQRQRRAASAGVDGMTVERYERDLERNIRDLCDRVHSGRYRPQPVRRTYIPKADGGAGVIERGEWKDAIDGTPQGAGISPLLASVFLHYVFDLWVHRWRKQAYGCVSVVRCADDFVMAFESEADARKMFADLTERLAEFGLVLHEEKTRLIMFGKYAAERRLRIGNPRPYSTGCNGIVPPGIPE